MGPSVRGVGIGDVVAASLVAGLAAWTVRWLLARNLYGARWWPFLGSAVLAASIIAPSRLADGTASLALIAMHLAVGFVLIAGFNERQRSTVADVPNRSAVDPGEQQQMRRPRGWRAGEARLLADDQGIACRQARR